MLKSELYQAIDRVLFILDRASTLQMKYGTPMVQSVSTIGRVMTDGDHAEVCRLLRLMVAGRTYRKRRNEKATTKRRSAKARKR